MSRDWHRSALVLRGAIVAALLLTAAASYAAGGGYTRSQATSGGSVYASTCAQCHGAQLQGGAGPPLTGASFRSAINGSYQTAEQLYDFIDKQMPANAPGSLSTAQALNVIAYILQRNGFAAGSTALSTSNAGSVRLAGARITAQTNAPTVEIVRAAAPKRLVFAAIPSSTDVNITDAMLRGAAQTANDWLLTGRTWDNDRYSPLDQITNENVGSLTPSHSSKQGSPPASRRRRSRSTA